MANDTVFQIKPFSLCFFLNTAVTRVYLDIPLKFASYSQWREKMDLESSKLLQKLPHFLMRIITPKEVRNPQMVWHCFVRCCHNS